MSHQTGQSGMPSNYLRDGRAQEDWKNEKMSFILAKLEPASDKLEKNFVGCLFSESVQSKEEEDIGHETLI